MSLTAAFLLAWIGLFVVGLTLIGATIVAERLMDRAKRSKQGSGR